MLKFLSILSLFYLLTPTFSWALTKVDLSKTIPPGNDWSDLDFSDTPADQIPRGVFDGKTLTRCIVSGNLRESGLQGATFDSVTFKDVKSLPPQVFANKNLNSSKLMDLDLADTGIEHATTFNSADLSRVKNLPPGVFAGKDVMLTKLVGVNLSGSKFEEGTNIGYNDLTNARLTKDNLNFPTAGFEEGLFGLMAGAYPGNPYGYDNSLKFYDWTIPRKDLIPLIKFKRAWDAEEAKWKAAHPNSRNPNDGPAHRLVKSPCKPETGMGKLSGLPQDVMFEILKKLDSVDQRALRVTGRTGERVAGARHVQEWYKLLTELSTVPRSDWDEEYLNKFVNLMKSHKEVKNIFLGESRNKEKAGPRPAPTP